MCPYLVNPPINIPLWTNPEWDIVQHVNSATSISVTASHNSSTAIFTFMNLPSLYSKYDILRDTIQENRYSMSQNMTKDIPVYHIWKSGEDLMPQYVGAYFIVHKSHEPESPVCLKLFCLHDLLLTEVTVTTRDESDPMISDVVRCIEKTFGVEIHYKYINKNATQ